jgi:hypothetical protein
MCSKLFVGSFIFIFFYSSCSNPLKEDIDESILLNTQEVLIDVPSTVTNAWDFLSEVEVNDQKLLYVWDNYKKAFHKFDLSNNQHLSSIFPFQDTVAITDLVSFSKLKEGYFIDALQSFIWMDENGKVLKVWDKIFPRRNQIPDYNYSHFLMSSSYLKHSLITENETPLNFRMNGSLSRLPVFNKEFYEFGILGSLNFKTGVLNRFDIRFPDNLTKDGKAFPKHYPLSFTGMEDGRIAYIFGNDEHIYVFDSQTGEHIKNLVINSEMRVSPYLVSEEDWNSPSFRENYNSNLNSYNHLYYDPYRKVYIRLLNQRINGVSNFHLEFINNKFELLGSMPISKEYWIVPLFYSDGIYFPYRAYKEDQIKFLKVTLDLIN